MFFFFDMGDFVCPKSAYLPKFNLRWKKSMYELGLFLMRDFTYKKLEMAFL